MRRLSRAAGVALAACLALSPAAGKSAGAGAKKGASAGPLPKLVVLIAVDQMRADYPERFERYFGEGGFRRLAREGKVFTRARYSHASTITGPGHSLIGSGIYGNHSGIVGNRWYSYGTGKIANCALGPAREGKPGECAPEGNEGAPVSGVVWMKDPCAFEGTSLAERVKGRFPDARVVGVSVKDRAAILMPGKKADAAYWVEEAKDGSASIACSAYYPACRPDVLAYGREEGLEEKPVSPGISSLFRKHPVWREWDCSLPSPCEAACPEDVADAHAESSGLGKRFPHPVRDAGALFSTPYGSDFLEGFAEKVVEAHALGRNPRGAPDVLTVSFSSTDYFGHPFGPDSCEAADGMKRLDATLGRFLQFLAARVGRESLLVFLTGDHGVAPLPEVSLRKGIAAGRLDFYDPSGGGKGTLGDLSPIRQRIEYSLARRLGIPETARTPLSSALVLAYQEPNLFLDRQRIGEKSLPIARAWLKEDLLHVEGIEAVYTADEIEAGEAPEPVRLAFRKDRSGDLVIQLRPYWTMGGTEGGADHGQIYDYDSRVPLMVWGGGIAPGGEPGEVDVAQIAPTLAGILGLDMAGFSRPSPLPLGRGR